VHILIDDNLFFFWRPSQPEPDRPTWKKAFELYSQAFKEPKAPQDQKKLTRILKKPLPAAIERGLFDYETGFLRNLGKMSLSTRSRSFLHRTLPHIDLPQISKLMEGSTLFTHT